MRVMLWLMVGGPFHGTWKEIDESLFHYDLVNLPDYNMMGWDQIMGWDHTPRMVSYFKMQFDIIPPHQTETAYMTVLVSGTGVIDDIPDKTLDAFCKAIGLWK